MARPYILPDELTTDLDQKWDNFLASLEKHQVDIPDLDRFRTNIYWLFCLSEFIYNGCITHPQILDSLIRTQDLCRYYDNETYPQLIKARLSQVSEVEQIKKILRESRLREMMRIAWRDLSGWVSLKDTLKDLSNFADAVLNETLNKLYHKLSLQYGTPKNDAGEDQQLVVIGMGKLGGRELNFSSDIDLIFAFPESGYTDHPDNSTSNDEFFQKLSRQYIEIIGENTVNGIVFRCDMRLRPFGQNGPLVMNFDGLEHYYQTQGRGWERYAWIKARIVAGDQVAGAQLFEILRPFVYRKYLDYGAFETLRNMKQMIDREVKRKELIGDIKIGSGGIREIEFFTQIFQLIRGGLIKKLQQGSIFKVLIALVEEKIITQETQKDLKTAYIFYRNLEHRLQMYMDQQTHKLPLEPSARLRLATAMGYNSWKALEHRIDYFRQKIETLFGSLMGSDEKKSDEKEQRLENVWQGNENDDFSIDLLKQAGYDDPKVILGILTELKNHLTQRVGDGEGQRRIDRLIPLVLKKVGEITASKDTFIQIIEFIKTLERRTSYIALLIEHPKALEQLILLSAKSPLVINLLTRFPLLLDELIDPRILYNPPKRKQLISDLTARMEKISHDDIEAQMDELRIFKQISLFRVIAADINNALSLMEVSDRLTYIAETILSKVLEICWVSLTQNYGEPTCILNNAQCHSGFAIIAYGKLAGLELGYGSDLDLVFLHAGNDSMTIGQAKSIENIMFMTRLGQKIINFLSTHTIFGPLYEPDLRLRPSGSSGVLVSHVESFYNYQVESAQTWEHQAIVRSRAICGDPAVCQHFENIRHNILCQKRDPEILRKDVFSMRERLRKEQDQSRLDLFDIKQGLGGIVDIEFLVQYFILRFAHQHPELTKWPDDVRLLENLASLSILTHAEAEYLTESYLALRKEAHRLSLQHLPAFISSDWAQQHTKKVIDIWNKHLNIN